MLWVWVLNMVTAGAFSYRAARDEYFRENRAVLWIGMILFVFLGAAWLSTIKISSFGGVFIAVVSTAIIGMMWGLFFTMCISEKMGRGLYSLLGGAFGSGPKTYDKAVAREIDNDFESAMKFYLGYQEEDPSDYLIEERIGRCLFHLKKPGKAIQSLQNTLTLLNSPEVHLPKDKKREEMARLLFLQKIIRANANLPEDQYLEETLCTKLSDTRFGAAYIEKNIIATTYLEIWSDCTAKR